MKLVVNLPHIVDISEAISSVFVEETTNFFVVCVVPWWVDEHRRRIPPITSSCVHQTLMGLFLEFLVTSLLLRNPESHCFSLRFHSRIWAVTTLLHFNLGVIFRFCQAGKRPRREIVRLGLACLWSFLCSKNLNAVCFILKILRFDLHVTLYNLVLKFFKNQTFSTKTFLNNFQSFFVSRNCIFIGFDFLMYLSFSLEPLNMQIELRKVQLLLPFDFFFAATESQLPRQVGDTCLARRDRLLCEVQSLWVIFKIDLRVADIEAELGDDRHRARLLIFGKVSDVTHREGKTFEARSDVAHHVLAAGHVVVSFVAELGEGLLLGA